MRDIKIEITKARMENFSVTFPESGMPEVSATLWLYTNGGKRISEFRINTSKYYWNTVELPMEIHTHLSNACEILERVAHVACNSNIGLIDSPKQKQAEEFFTDIPF